MAKPKNKKSTEEKLALQRLYKRKKYEEIKKDPEKYAAQKEKERLRYLRRKEQKKLKTIDDLTPRQQRQKRKLWRESRHRYVEKKKKEKIVEQMLIDNSPPTSDEETLQVPQVDPLEDQLPDLKAVSWNYMETGHGKGAPDGIGAVVKRTADKTVRFGRDIGTLKDFWLVIKEKIKNVEIRIVSKKDIEEKKTPRNLKSFKGTMSVHQVLWSANSLRMTFRKLSCFFCPNGVTCTHGYHLGYMNVHEDSMPHDQEDVLHDFLDENTTPEVIEEINNSPNNYFTNLNSFVYVQYSSPVTPKPSSSPKVKILSDVRLDWSNTSLI
ncbi:hypothetical protein ACJJTC_002303 [Scirpophaga incertulas]